MTVADSPGHPGVVGVIPKARAFSSGLRDLWAACFIYREIPSLRLKTGPLGMTPHKVEFKRT